MAMIIGVTFFACNRGVSVVSTELYDGQAPNGALGTISYIHERQVKGYRGLKVEISVNGFGDIPAVNANDVQQVSEKLVKYAKLVNEKTGYTDTQYYYTYRSKKFEPKSCCILTFYYMVPPDAANESLHFVFDYTAASGKQLYVKSGCNVFTPPDASASQQIHVN